MHRQTEKLGVDGLISKLYYQIKPSEENFIQYYTLYEDNNLTEKKMKIITYLVIVEAFKESAKCLST